MYPLPHKSTDLYALHSEWKVTEGVAEPNSIMGYKQAKWKTFVVEESFVPEWFHPILSPLKLILEMVFWTNLIMLMLDFICTWLEKTRRFCSRDARAGKFPGIMETFHGKFWEFWRGGNFWKFWEFSILTYFQYFMRFFCTKSTVFHFISFYLPDKKHQTSYCTIQKYYIDKIIK